MLFNVRWHNNSAMQCCIHKQPTSTYPTELVPILSESCAKKHDPPRLAVLRVMLALDQPTALFKAAVKARCSPILLASSEHKQNLLCQLYGKQLAQCLSNGSWLLFLDEVPCPW